MLLRELLRTSLAVESEPMRAFLAQNGVPTDAVPDGIYMPTNASWARLAVWILPRRSEMPLRALPDIVELFQNLSASMFFADPLTPRIAEVLALWLTEVEGGWQAHPLAERQPHMAAASSYGHLAKLASSIRQAFFLMAHRAPEHAKAYLKRVMAQRDSSNTVREIMKFRGSLAQAAPAELADLTFAGLVANEPARGRSVWRDDPFTFLDNEFLPSSPAQGLFLELLTSASQHGLVLIRRLVDHATAARSGGRAPDTDGLTLVIDGKARFFPWTRSYFWPREGEGSYAVESGLMALEAWSHARIERGEAPGQVIADILGDEGAPAAYLLVAVDVILSHWPKTRAAAVPFVGSPELLSIDRTRQLHDQRPELDFGGWGAIEPSGPVRLVDLEKRPSREMPLETLLGAFVGKDADNESAELHRLLTDAATRLGPPDELASFADPAFMVLYALNVTDPANWPTIGQVSTYVSPASEAEHLARLQGQHLERHTDLSIEAALQNALTDSTRSSPEIAAHCVDYAKRRSAAGQDENGDELRMRKHAIFSAAMIAMRDGAADLVEQHEAWARGVFEDALASTDDISVSRMREGIRFNPVSIATVGLIHLWRRNRTEADRDALLALAARKDPHAAQGFRSGLVILWEVDERIIPAVLRCAIAAQVSTVVDWDAPDELKHLADACRAERMKGVLAAEIAWLDGNAAEPTWPVLPACHSAVRRNIGRAFASAAPETEDKPITTDLISSQSAALWLRQLADPLTIDRAPWIADLVATYAEWTASANGAGLDTEADIDRAPVEWNNIFYSLLVRAIPIVGGQEARKRFEQVAILPGERFFDISARLVRSLDETYFNDRGLDLATALEFRGILARRLMETHGWCRDKDRVSFTVEMHIAPAIATLFMNEHSSFSATKCYLLEKGMDKIEPFLAGMAAMMETGPVPFLSMLTLNLLEVSPRSSHAGFLLGSADVWLRRVPANAELWVDHGIGARIARWLEQVSSADPSLRAPGHHLRPLIDSVLARLVRVGVAEAHRVETLITSLSRNGFLDRR